MLVSFFSHFSYPLGMTAATIDYRCEDGRIPVSASCVKISNPNSLSSSEKEVNLGIRSWKKCLSEWAWCQKVIGGIYLTKKWRAETLQPGFDIYKFNPQLKSCIFECISWLNGSFFVGDDRGILKEGVKTFLMAPMSPLNSPTFFHLHIYSLCKIPGVSKNRLGRTFT